MPFRSHLPALLLALSLTGCGDDYAPPEGPVSPEAYAVELASAYCTFGLRCESASDLTRFSAFCHPVAVEQKLAYLLERQLHMAYDRDAAMRCLATIEDATGRCITPLCEPVLIGTRSAGASCDDATQCAPGLTCTGRDVGARCSGTCEPAATEGGRCRESHECAAGLHCDRNRCVVDGDEGDGCSASTDCGFGLSCDRELGECYSLDDAEGRVCTLRGPNRDTCPVPTDCVDGYCERYTPGQVAGPGEPCAPGECAADHFCESGTCAPNPRLTEACDDDTRSCVEGRCVDGTCQLLPARAPCDSDSECASDRCMGVCDVPAAVGSRCDDERDCANGLQCDDGRCVVRSPCG